MSIPKGLSILKNTMESHFSKESKFTTVIAKRYREVSEVLVPIRENQQQITTDNKNDSGSIII